MKKLGIVLISVCLLSLLALAETAQMVTSLISSEDINVIDTRQLTFFNEMLTRNAEYKLNADWTLKVFPADLEYLKTDTEEVYIEVYVTDTVDKLQTSHDRKTGAITNTFEVFTASENAVTKLSQIPHSYFYASMFSPSVGMTIQKQDLSQIANDPSVYCIRIIPPLEPFLGIYDVREMNDIAYTMADHDTTLDASTWIVVIGSGYDPNDSYFGGDANDNILPNTSWDFTDNNTDVSNGENVHESSVTDTLVNNFGDNSQTDFSMYENRNFWTPLKISDDSYSTANQYASQAIEWCIAQDVDIVCMSWGSEPGLIGNDPCNGWWCDRFRVGTLGGTTWVAAAGNAERTNGVAYPAESHYVIAVGAYDSNPAVRQSYSDYGNTRYALYSPYYPWYIADCATCYAGQGSFNEFKPNAYECGYLGYWGWGQGTSYSAPLACADIAIGIHSANGGDYTGYEYLLDVLALSNEYPVSPTDSSQQGDVLDTHTLWHRQVVTP
jgi:hypothetical protein